MTALYVPPTEESDHKKQNMSLQLIGGQTSTNTTAIATNTTAIATLNALRASSSTFGLAEVDNVTITAAAGVISTVNPLPAPIKASLLADVALNNTANYFDGPSVAQGTSGTWVASGTVTLTDTAGGAAFFAKLWDGTTVIASAPTNTAAATGLTTISLSGTLASPAANIRISVRDTTSVSGKILFNTSGNSKDSTITAYRIA